MIIRIIIGCIVSSSLLLPFYVANAVEPLSTEELASHCAQYEKNPNGVDAVFCVRYIHILRNEYPCTKSD